MLARNGRSVPAIRLSVKDVSTSGIHPAPIARCATGSVTTGARQQVPRFGNRLVVLPYQLRIQRTNAAGLAIAASYREGTVFHFVNSATAAVPIISFTRAGRRARSTRISTGVGAPVPLHYRFGQPRLLIRLLMV